MNEVTSSKRKYSANKMIKTIIESEKKIAPITANQKKVYFMGNLKSLKPENRPDFSINHPKNSINSFFDHSSSMASGF